MDPEILEALGLTEDDWDNMSPRDQATVMQQIGLQQANSLPVSFLGSAGAPSLSAGAFDLSGMMGGATFQNYDSKGNPEPIDQSQAGQINNLMQDQASLYVDNVLAMLSGPGAYETGAFTPQRRMGKLLPGRAQIDALANNPTGGFRSLIAAQIRNGASPEEAENAVWDAISRVDTDDESLSDADRARVQSLLATLPSARSTGSSGTGIGDYMASQTGATTGIEGRENRAAYDQAAISKAAQDMFTSWTTEQDGWQDPDTGRWYDTEPEETKTPIMEWYDKYQLPYPTSSYGDEQHVGAAVQANTGRSPEMQQFAVEDYANEMSGVMGNRDRALTTASKARDRATEFAKQMDEYTKAFETWRNKQPTYTPPAQPGRNGQLPQEQAAALATTGLGTGIQMPGQSYMEVAPSMQTPAPEAPFVYENAAGRVRAGDRDRLESQFGIDRLVGFANALRSGKTSPADLKAATSGGALRRATGADVGTMQTQARDAAKKGITASNEYSKATWADPDLDRLYAQVYGGELQRKGRSPLRDALAQRALAASVMRGY